MSKTIKLSLLALILALSFSFVDIVLAQETTVSPEVIEAVNLDENIQAEDLGVGEPRILPDSPFYFLKRWTRQARVFFAFNPVVRAELRERFANEKLVELKEMIEKNKDPEVIKQAVENYQDEIEKIKQASEQIRERAKENPKVESFLDKFIHQQTLHQKLLQKLEDQVPPQAFEKIKEAREEHLERFKDVMLKLEDREEKITEKLDKILEEQKGSQFKELKNLEVLKNLEEKVPEEAKEAIRKAQENALKRLKGDLEEMLPEDQEKFKDYIEKISGEKEKHLEILENLKSELEEKPEIKQKLIQIRETVMERIKETAEERNCPEIQKPDPGFCKEGRIVIKKDEASCIIFFECVIPAEVEIYPKPEKPAVCITLWDPVCGDDGKTYSNACFAQLAGVEIAYRGECKEKACHTDTDCLQPKCGPVGSIQARCVGVRAKCVEGKCLLSPSQ